ncbi:acyl-ACP--UDP-N-acetylglucosamine O-acyltransferase [Desulfovibrio sp. JC010]|uniref:acyl-ACP--UDP-N-acetylglucosamine O-acyltransferase n=1 Tax=Desulfovibrio sp. JC010 TaxID=2593641 RepID=UPI0013D169B8|nr:acyl-ACP--UDP-N-acetylglucosamine O-acyltransferase [Desulfovibrio sp. JC010]
MATEIHPSAIVDSGAQLGENVKIGPFCIIEGNTVIGDDCTLGANVQIKSFTRMGKGNTLDSGVVLGGLPQHLGFKGEETWVVLGDNNILREYVTIHRATGVDIGRESTIVGNNCMIMAYAHVAHDCTLGDHVIIANAANIAGHVDVGNYVTIGGMAGLHQFVRIGDYAFVGAMSGFGQDIPPYMIATGVRGVLQGPNSIGLRRNGFKAKTCNSIKKAYRLIFRSETPRKEALDQAEQEFADVPEVQNLIEFIRSSKRGVTSAGHGSKEI